MIGTKEFNVESESQCAKNWLTAPGKIWLKLSDCLNITIAVDWDVKEHSK